MTARRTLEERIAMVLMYAEFQNLEEVRRRWRYKFDSSPPAIETIQSTYLRFTTSGTVAEEARPGRICTTVTPERVIQARELVTQDPNTTISIGAAALQISKTSYYRIMRKLNFRPYLPHHVPALKPQDIERRNQLCGEILVLIDSHPTAIDHIIWSDESMFYLSGTICRHNNVRWGPKNPHEQIEVPHCNQSIMVWCGITSSQLIGPHFFHGPVDRAAYLEVLEVVWPFARHKRMFFQHDGAPAHYAIQVQNWLNQKFPQKWIGRGGPYLWPARSPDLAPCDYFLWGYLKSRVYRAPRPSTIAELQARITESCAEIPANYLKNASRAAQHRFEECIALGGQQLQN